MKRSLHEARRQMFRRIERSMRRANKQQLRSIPFAPECHLPLDGAVSVLCDECFDALIAKTPAVTLKFAVDGYPFENKRVPIESLKEPFGHDLAKHELYERRFGVRTVPSISPQAFGE